MATVLQIDAGRNALKPAGPLDPLSKAASSRNSLRHGLRARTVVLPGESRREFNLLCDHLETEWQPKTCTEQFYLEQMAISQWKLTRMEVGEAYIYRKPAEAWKQLPLVDRFWQAQDRMEKSYARAQRELERLQHSQDPEPDPRAAAANPPSADPAQEPVERHHRAAA